MIDIDLLVGYECQNHSWLDRDRICEKLRKRLKVKSRQKYLEEYNKNYFSDLIE